MDKSSFDQLVIAVNTLNTTVEGIKDLLLSVIEATNIKTDISLKEIDATLSDLVNLTKSVTENLQPDLKDEIPIFELIQGGKTD